MDLFDMLNYLRDYYLFSEKYKKVVGKMKDEMVFYLIFGFVGLWLKMYLFIVYDEKKM